MLDIFRNEYCLLEKPTNDEYPKYKSFIEWIYSIFN